MMATPTNSYVPSAPGAAGIASDSAMPLMNSTSWTGVSCSPTELVTAQATRIAVNATIQVSPTTIAAPRTVVIAPAPAATRSRSPNTSPPKRVARTRGRDRITTMITSAMTPAMPAPMAKTARSRSSAIPEATTMLETSASRSIVSPSPRRSMRIVPNTASRGIRNASPARMARAMSPRRAGRIAFAVKPIIR